MNNFRIQMPGLTTIEDCFSALERLNKMGFFGVASGVDRDSFTMPSKDKAYKMLDEIIAIYLTDVMMRLHDLSFNRVKLSRANSLFVVELVNYGNRKIDVIKLIRNLTNMTLKEAKDFVEATTIGAQTIPLEPKTDKAASLIVNQFAEIGALARIVKENA